MPHPSTCPEILAALESNANSIAAFFTGQPDRLIFTGDPDHWGPGHHLAHLTRTSGAIARAMQSESLPLYSGSRSRTYAQVLDAATSSLTTTSKDRLLEMGRVVVIAPGSRGADLVKDFVATSLGLRAVAAEWAENELDRRALTHPLIGEMTAREMLFFCVFHERHHLKLVRARLEAPRL